MISVLDAIESALQTLCASADIPMEGVWYGACRADKLDKWNYFVFNKQKTTKSSNRCDFQTFYQVNIIHEDYIPEGYVEKVIQALESQSVKLRCTGDDVEYYYTFKGNTNMVVEMATITLFHPEKRC